jgi:hypothetical protein
MTSNKSFYETPKQFVKFGSVDKQPHDVIKRKFSGLNVKHDQVTSLVTSDSINETVLVNKNKMQRKSSALSNELLLSDDGLEKVYKTFPTVCKFRGKGFETQDLKNLMRSYKEWAWMLNPGSAFPDFLIKCESLGKTDACKVYMNQLRDMERIDFQQRKHIVKTRKNVSFV